MWLKSNHFFRQTSQFGRKIIISVVSVLVILAIVLFFLGRNYMRTALLPLNQHSTRMVQIHVPFGASNRKIGSILQKRKVVRNGLAFDYYIKSHNFHDFQAGYYRFSPSMSLAKISRRLQEGGLAKPFNPHAKVTLKIKRGMRASQLLQQIQRSSQVPTKTFVNLLTSRRFINQMAQEYPNLRLKSALKTHQTVSLIRYLLPGSYFWRTQTSFKTLISEMLNKTNRFLKNRQVELKQRNLTVPQLLNLSVAVNHLNSADERNLSSLIAVHQTDLKHRTALVVANRRARVISKTEYRPTETDLLPGSTDDLRNLLSSRGVKNSDRIYLVDNQHHVVTKPAEINRDLLRQILIKAKLN